MVLRVTATGTQSREGACHASRTDHLEHGLDGCAAGPDASQAGSTTPPGLALPDQQALVASIHEQLLCDYREKALADPLADIRTSMHDAPPEDQAVLSDPTFQQILRQDRTEALRPGAEGWCDECLAASDWDIAPEEVTVHVVWYHSRHDANEPLQAVQRLADRLPSVELRLWEGGHLEAFHRQEELIRDLLTRAGLRPSS
ncbi:hypothetical protein AB0I61_26440 [Polymorphospora rubra]|uniref:alpha/beta fold hydrolase n=1 Tax=Polymorphospora rubra TaxID=338584 RepID=UPI0033F28194